MRRHDLRGLWQLSNPEYKFGNLKLRKQEKKLVKNNLDDQESKGQI